MRKVPWFKAAIATLAFSVSGQAIAESRICSPRVIWTGIDPGGSMLVALENMGAANLCNVNGTVNTSRGAVTSETCRAWYAGFTTAHVRGAPVSLHYDFGAAAAPQCNALGYDYSLPNIYPYLITFNP